MQLVFPRYGQVVFDKRTPAAFQNFLAVGAAPGRPVFGADEFSHGILRRSFKDQGIEQSILFYAFLLRGHPAHMVVFVDK